jgi:endoglucanase
MQKWLILTLAILILLAGITGSGIARREPQTSPGYLRTSGSRILDSAGKTVAFSGLNWFGFETTDKAPHGLWRRNWEDVLDQIKSLGFNSIRLPFSNAMLTLGVRPSGIDYDLNPDLSGLTSLEVMDRIIAGAGERGIRVILDNHRSSPGGGPESNGLWYTDQYPETRWIADWEMLAERYKGNPTVVGMDLRNEPHAACWGCADPATDWRLAAERAGNAVLAINPDVLIMVEGVGVYNGQSTWWGGNLMGAKDHPVRLNVPDRLVYSAHEYPESIYPQPWFSDPNYPDNLAGVMDRYWGYLVNENLAPVLIGEFGTRYNTDKDQVWLRTVRNYIESKGLSWTFWCLNPNSGDTGGLFLDDWNSVHPEKYEILVEIQYDFINTTPQPGGIFLPIIKGNQ